MSDDRFGAKVEETLNKGIDGLAALEHVRNRLKKEFDALVGSSRDDGLKVSDDSTTLSRKTLTELVDAIQEHDLDPTSYSATIFAPRNGTDLFASINYFPKVKLISNFDISIRGSNKIQVDGVAHMARSLVGGIKAGRIPLATPSSSLTPAITPTAPATPAQLSPPEKTWWKGPLGWIAGIGGSLVVAYVAYLLGWN